MSQRPRDRLEKLLPQLDASRLAGESILTAKQFREFEDMSDNISLEEAARLAETLWQNQWVAKLLLAHSGILSPRAGLNHILGLWLLKLIQHRISQNPSNSVKISRELAHELMTEMRGHILKISTAHEASYLDRDYTASHTIGTPLRMLPDILPPGMMNGPIPHAIWPLHAELEAIDHRELIDMQGHAHLPDSWLQIASDRLNRRIKLEKDADTRERLKHDILQTRRLIEESAGQIEKIRGFPIRN